MVRRRSIEGAWSEEIPNTLRSMRDGFTPVAPSFRSELGVTVGVVSGNIVGLVTSLPALLCHWLWVWWLGGTGGCGSIDLLPLLTHQLRQSPQTLGSAVGWNFG